MIREGDIVSCASTGSWLSWMIREATDSGFSHTQLVVKKSPDPIHKPFDFQVLEVGWTIRIAKFSDLKRGQFRIDRPKAPPEWEQEVWGEQVALDVKRLMRKIEDEGKTRYPWWKLPAYLFGDIDWIGKLILSGPRQVCSVMSIRPLVARGWTFYAYDDNERRLIDTHDEIQSIVPGQIVRFFVESGTPCIYKTKLCPPV